MDGAALNQQLKDAGHWPPVVAECAVRATHARMRIHHTVRRSVGPSAVICPNPHDPTAHHPPRAPHQRTASRMRARTGAALIPCRHHATMTHTHIHPS